MSILLILGTIISIIFGVGFIFVLFYFLKSFMGFVSKTEETVKESKNNLYHNLFIGMGKENYVFVELRKIDNSNNFGLIYFIRNEVVDIDFINNNSERIFEYLSLDKNYSMKILTENGHHLMLYFFVLESYEFSEKLFKKENIFVGLDEMTKPVYVPVAKFSHLLVGGVPGSGKSNTVNLLIASLFYNINTVVNGKDLIKSIYMVDFKMGIEFFPYSNLSDKIEVVSDMARLNDILDTLNNEMIERSEEMKEQGIKTKTDNKIFLIIDEFAEIKNFIENNRHNRELQNLGLEVEGKLKRLVALSRAMNISVWVSTQKPTVDNIASTLRENLQSRICLKVKTIDNLEAIMGNTEEVKEMGLSPQSFKQGEFVFTDFVTNKNYHVLSCYVPDGFEKLPFFDFNNTPLIAQNGINFEKKDISDSIDKDEIDLIENSPNSVENENENLVDKEKVDLVENSPNSVENKNEIFNVSKTIRLKIETEKLFRNLVSMLDNKHSVINRKHKNGNLIKLKIFFEKEECTYILYEKQVEFLKELISNSNSKLYKDKENTK